MAKLDRILSSILRHSRTLIIAAGVTCVAIASIYFTLNLTADRIEHNEHAWLAAQINALVPLTLHDNDLLADHIEMKSTEFFGTDAPIVVYRATHNGLPVAAVINSSTTDGYGGPIELLIAINFDGDVMGVRILSHHETPGIGNAFESPGSHWLDAFKGHSTHNPDTAGWNVRKDGGEFEQFTSATITPRAIIKAVHRTVDFFQHHRDDVFATP